MRMLTRREAACAVFAFFLGIVTPAVLQAAERNPFLVVDGDGWLTSNADYADNTWSAPNVNRPAFGLQLSNQNDLPFDRGTAGATFWVRNAGCAYRFESFGDPCGWQLGLAVTQFRSIVVGGQGMEVDGLGAPPPYARVINTTDDGARIAGMVTNSFVDFSGVDSSTSPSWFDGFELDRDTFAVRRAPAGSQQFSDLFTVDRDGNAAVTGSLATSQALQSAHDQWAARARLVGGRYTFHYAKPFAQTPVCVATSEGGTQLRVTPSAGSCAVTSRDPRDSSMIDVVVVGNPS
ncbi:MAG TPA: hypothetical protein VMD47_01370 [Candidatus Acidoferrales bacterium]|nr:hypothetical protein [Candidatus Acidoferrales bacterium]